MSEPFCLFYDVFESIILHINNASLVFLRKIMSNVVTANLTNNCRSLLSNGKLPKKARPFFSDNGRFFSFSVFFLCFVAVE